MPRRVPGNGSVTLYHNHASVQTRELPALPGPRIPSKTAVVVSRRIRIPIGRERVVKIAGLRGDALRPFAVWNIRSRA